jgi:hypothetical protein
MTKENLSCMMYGLIKRNGAIIVPDASCDCIVIVLVQFQKKKKEKEKDMKGNKMRPWCRCGT